MAHGEDKKYRLSETADVMFNNVLEYDFINGGFKEKPITTSTFKPFKKKERIAPCA